MTEPMHFFVLANLFYFSRIAVPFGNKYMENKLLKPYMSENASLSLLFFHMNIEFE